MLQITIDNKTVKVPTGTTVFKAAEKLGISIPTMCFKEGYSNHPSCMVCLVKVLDTGQLQPSCALPVKDGMKISTNAPEVIIARREALELLLSDHVGDCEAPCRTTCPAFMDIPKMNRLIADKKFDLAIQVVKEDIALPYILGYICPAPCEKACRRSQVDKAISICKLKKFVASVDAQKNTPYFPKKQRATNKKVAIIGTGAAGLACAFYLLKDGHECVFFDKNEKAGGTLRYEISEEKLPSKILDYEIELIQKYGAKFILNKLITKDIFENELRKEYDAIVFATGNFTASNITDFGFEKEKIGIKIDKNSYTVNNLGIFACGNIIRSRKLAVKSVAQGKETAFSVNLFLQGKEPIIPKRQFNSKFGKLFPSEIKEYLKETSIKSSDPSKIVGTIKDNEDAILEAKRCMNCDCRKPSTCKLRLYSDEYQADRRKYMYGERKTIKKYFRHETIVYEPEKCIKCNLCVEITTKNNELIGLTAIGRGFEVEINVPFNKPINEALLKTAEECANNCPTGAISKKIF